MYASLLCQPQFARSGHKTPASTLRHLHLHSSWVPVPTFLVAYGEVAWPSKTGKISAKEFPRSTGKISAKEFPWTLVLPGIAVRTIIHGRAGNRLPIARGASRDKIAHQLNVHRANGHQIREAISSWIRRVLSDTRSTGIIMRSLGLGPGPGPGPRALRPGSGEVYRGVPTRLFCPTEEGPFYPIEEGHLLSCCLSWPPCAPRQHYSTSDLCRTPLQSCCFSWLPCSDHCSTPLKASGDSQGS